MDRLLSEKAVLEAILGEPTDAHYPSWYAEKVRKLPSAEPHSINLNQGQSSDLISRAKALDPHMIADIDGVEVVPVSYLRELPSAEPQTEINMAYMQGKIDGINYCTERLRKMRMEVDTCSTS